MLVEYLKDIVRMHPLMDDISNKVTMDKKYTLLILFMYGPVLSTEKTIENHVYGLETYSLIM